MKALGREIREEFDHCQDMDLKFLDTVLTIAGNHPFPAGI